MASLLNIIFSFPTLILVSRSCLLNCWRCDLENSTASVLDVSYVTAFVTPHSKTVLATVFKVRAIFLTEVPEAINPKSSTNDRDVL